MKRKRTCLAALLATALLSACAGTPRMSDAERLQLHRSHAGEPVAGFHLPGQLNGWNALGDEALVVWTRPREAWLLELAGPCNDLRHATALSLTSTGSRVQARFDSVLPLGPMVGQVGRVPCRIETIRPLDTAALRQAGDALREARIEARD